MGYVLVTPPALEPVTLAEAKLWCRVDGTDEDTLITSLIVAAREACEAETGLSFITQTWRADFSHFPCVGQALRLPHGPVQSITSVYYYDDQGVDTLLAASGYEVDLTNQMTRIWLAPDEVWPSIEVQANAIRVTYVAGFGAAATAVPARAKLAMQAAVTFWYDNRGQVGELGAIKGLLVPMTVQSLA